MSKQIIIFYDLETTGLSTNRHSIHQIAGLVEVDGVAVERFNIKVQPHPKAEITDKALEVGGVTREDLAGYMPMEEGYRQLDELLSRYIDRYDKTDKAWLCGYNNRYFDDQFLRRWFEHNGNPYFGSWFWSDTLDVFVLASHYLMNRRAGMPNFQQQSVARELGIEVDESRLHDAEYDVNLTRAIYEIVTGLEIEI